MAKKSSVKITKSKTATGTRITATKGKRTHEGINKTTGRLKKGYKYDSSGRIVKVAAKPKRKTTPALRSCAKQLGSKGGRVTAAKRKTAKKTKK